MTAPDAKRVSAHAASSGESAARLPRLRLLCYHDIPVRRLLEDVLQNHFDKEWTPLARRYSLWLYREVGWEGNEVNTTVLLSTQIFD